MFIIPHLSRPRPRPTTAPHTGSFATTAIVAALTWGTLALSGCGGGGGGSGGAPADTTAPRVSSVSPPADATAVPTDTRVSVTFSEAVDCATVNSQRLTLAYVDGTTLAGSITCNGNRVEFAPPTALKKEARLVARLAKGVKDLAGNELASGHSWEFSVVGRAWSAAEFVTDASVGRAYAPRIAFDRQGAALALWTESSGSYYTIGAGRYSPGSGWSSIEFGTEPPGYYISADLAVDASGNAVAVWSQFDDARYNIWGRYYTAGSGWGSATLLESGDGNAHAPTAALDASGNAMVVWYQEDGSTFSIWSNRHTAAGWGTPELVEHDDTGSGYEPGLAVAGDGSAIAIWQQTTGTASDIRVSRYLPDSGWSAATTLDSEDAGAVQMPAVVVSADGSAMAAWRQAEGTRFTIRARRFTPEGGWEPVGGVTGDGTEDVDYPVVAMDGKGNSVVLWRQFGSGRSSIWANRFTKEQGWGTAAAIDVAGDGNSAAPWIAIDADGNALALWEQENGSRVDIGWNRFHASAGWGTAGFLQNSTGGDAYVPTVGFTPEGDAIAVWQQSDGDRYGIASSRFE